MRTASSHLEYVERAGDLADQLQGVKRNVFLSLVADFMSDPRNDASRLRRTLELLGRGNGGHLERSGSFGYQARTICRILPPFLAQNELPDAALRAVLGWTARLLLTKRPPKAPSGSSSGGGHIVRPTIGREVRATKPPPRRPERPKSTPTIIPPSTPAQPSWKASLQGLGWGNADQVSSVLMKNLEGEERVEAAKAIIERLGGKREFRSRKDKPWVQDLFAAAKEE